MQRLVDAGELTEEEAEQSERRNIILQALGPDPRVKVDLTQQTAPPRRHADHLLRRAVRPGAARGVRGHRARSSRSCADLCAALIDLANERGGPDNITVVAARFEGEGLPEPSEAEDVGYAVYHLPDGDSGEERAADRAGQGRGGRRAAAHRARQPRRARCCSWPRCSA